MVGSLTVSVATAADIGIEVRGSSISVSAEDVLVVELLDALATAVGFRLIVTEPDTRRTSIDVDELSLSEVVSKVMGEHSYQLVEPKMVDGEQATTAAAMLWVFGEGNGDYLSAYLEAILVRGTVAERKDAIRSLSELGTPAAINAISLALSDDDDRVRRTAMQALSDVGGDDAAAVLSSAMVAEEPLTRARAIESLGLMESSASRTYLDMALRDDDPRVRAAALESLADIGNTDARRRLRNALTDQDPGIRERALDILEELDDEAMFHTVFPTID